MKKKDYLSLSPAKRKLLSGKKEPSPKKAEPDPKQIPLLWVKKEPFEYIRPELHCDGCGLELLIADELQLRKLPLFGCPECGELNRVRVIETWE